MAKKKKSIPRLSAVQKVNMLRGLVNYCKAVGVLKEFHWDGRADRLDGHFQTAWLVFAVMNNRTVHLWSEDIVVIKLLQRDPSMKSRIWHYLKLVDKP